MQAGTAPIVLAFLLVASVAAAQQPATTQALGRGPAGHMPPYTPVGIKLPEAPGDKSFAGFRSELAAAARARVYADLARLVIDIGFFWDRDFEGAFNPRGSGIENLAKAIRLEAEDGAGWTRLATLAAESTAGPTASRRGVLCGPAAPSYDGVQFDELILHTRTTEADWSYPRGERIPLRASPRANAPVVETLGMAFVRRVPEAETAGFTAEPSGWIRVAAPSGRIGFVSAALIRSLRGEQLCYGKDFAGRWRIVGYIGPTS